MATAKPLLELLERYGGVALTRVLKHTGDDQRCSRNLDLLLRKLECFDLASQQVLRTAYAVPAVYSAEDWERVHHLENSGLIRFGLHGQDPYPTAGLCAENCLGRACRQLQQHCATSLPVFCQARTTFAATPVQPGLRATFGRFGYHFTFSTYNGLADPRCDPSDLSCIEVGAAIAAHPGQLAWRIHCGARP